MRRLMNSGNHTTTVSARRGDAAKVIIITVCVFALILLLLCVGAGVYGYVLFQRNFGRALVESPADIQKMTTEITEIDIPSQFTPVMGSAFLGMKNVNFAWNPEGKAITTESWQETRGPLMPVLNLMEMASEPSLITDADFQIDDFLRTSAKALYVEFTQVEKEFDIRGRKCQFLFVTGRPKEGAFENPELLYEEIDEEEMKAEEAAEKEMPTPTEDTPADATAPTEAPQTTPVPAEPITENEKPKTQEVTSMPAVRTVTGKFPGKSGPTTIEIRIPAEDSDEDLLLKIIQSIR